MPHYTPTKQCTKCGNVLPATTEYFYKELLGKFGVRSKCIKCINHPKTRRVGRDKEKARACRERWKNANPEKDKAAKRKYYDAHREEEIQKVCDKQKKNPEWVAQRNKKWKAAHPEAVSQMSSKRRARIASADGRYSRKDVLEKFEQQCGKCYWCKKEINGRYHVDHVVPLSRGGSNWPSNIVITCPHCNMSKNDKLPEEWSH